MPGTLNCNSTCLDTTLLKEFKPRVGNCHLFRTFVRCPDIHYYSLPFQDEGITVLSLFWYNDHDNLQQPCTVPLFEAKFDVLFNL